MSSGCLMNRDVKGIVGWRGGLLVGWMGGQDLCGVEAEDLALVVLLAFREAET